MKALMKLQRGDGFVELREVEEPRPVSDEVLVEVKRAGICFTDIHILHNEFPKANPPFILGHEFSGVIKRVGTDVRDWKVGIGLFRRRRLIHADTAVSAGRATPSSPPLRSAILGPSWMPLKSTQS